MQRLVQASREHELTIQELRGSDYGSMILGIPGSSFDERDRARTESEIINSYGPDRARAKPMPQRRVMFTTAFDLLAGEAGCK